ncbi:MAG TPA: DNA methyltransferase [Ignavibacteriaceae bacterium]
MLRIDLIKKLNYVVKKEDLSSIKENLCALKFEIEKSRKKNVTISYELNGTSSEIKSEFFLKEIDQILKTRTKERTVYYLTRLAKSLSENKPGKINDLNLNRWKEYDDLLTDSLWLINKRDQSGAHNAGYWGNFIPQIPNQFLRRFTKKGDWVLDPFAGSGTTLIECRRLGRNCIAAELNPDVVQLAKKNLEKEKPNLEVNTILLTGDSSTIDFKSGLKKSGAECVQLIIMHPPYWDIIKFSQRKNDLSNAKSSEDFLKLFGNIIDNTSPLLERGRYLAVVIGDKYFSGEWIPLGFFTMQEVLKRKFRLKSTIVKNFDITKGKMNQKELWRYRALAGGFYIFKHEYIFLFQKL